MKEKLIGAVGSPEPPPPRLAAPTEGKEGSVGVRDRSDRESKCTRGGEANGHRHLRRERVQGKDRGGVGTLILRHAIWVIIVEQGKWYPL